MSGLALSGNILTTYAKLTDNLATDLLALNKRVTVLSIWATENSGAMPALTLAITDGTTVWYMRNAMEMTARETVLFDEPFVLDRDKKLQATSNDAAGSIDVIVSYFNPDAVSR